MMDVLASWPPVLQALAASTFTWGVTALGAAVVFFVRDVRRSVLDASLGFAAGVMIAASFWSLLNPAIALAEEMGGIAWLPALVGFLAGASRCGWSISCCRTSTCSAGSDAEGVKTTWQRTTLLVLAITLHNMPEGLAIGVAFGAVARATTRPRSRPPWRSRSASASRTVPRAPRLPCRCGARASRGCARGGTASSRPRSSRSPP